MRQLDYDVETKVHQLEVTRKPRHCAENICDAKPTQTGPTDVVPNSGGDG